MKRLTQHTEFFETCNPKAKPGEKLIYINQNYGLMPIFPRGRLKQEERKKTAEKTAEKAAAVAAQL